MASDARKDIETKAWQKGRWLGKRGRRLAWLWYQVVISPFFNEVKSANLFPFFILSLTVDENRKEREINASLNCL